MDFFNTLEQILNTNSYQEKIKLSKLFINNFYENNILFNKNYNIKQLKPSYTSFCKIVKPTEVNIRGFNTKEKKASLIHSIVHIEYSAIDLAFDACYRFRNMPKKFYYDWIEVANDEIRHFEMLLTLLNKLGFDYGDFSVHNSLIEAAQRTNTLLERMAIVPRWLEANGLDKNEQIIEKLKYQKDPLSKELLDILKVILKEEISHVKKGDYWFKFECDIQNLDYNIYFDIVEKFYKINNKKHINIKARQEAGFSCQELKYLSKNVKC